MAPSFSGVWNISTQYQYRTGWPIDANLGAKGFFAGGSANAGTSNVVDVITIESTGANATDFGNLTATRTKGFATSNNTRGLITGGEGGISSAASIDYIELASAGNASDFGDLANHASFREDGCAFAGNVRAIFAGGNDNTGGGGVGKDYIDFVTIQTLGNAIDFGNLTDGLNANAGFASSTRGISSGGYNDAGSSSNIIQYVTIATTGNATDFGDLTAARYATTGCASATRGLTAGGVDGGSNNIIDYITIASIGNATDFGDLTKASYYNTACSNATKGLLTAGTNNSTQAVEFVTLATTSNSADFGDLSVARVFAEGFSDSTPSSALEAGFPPAAMGLFGGGLGDGSPRYLPTITYINIASTGDTILFGDLSVGRDYISSGGFASTTRGCFAGGYNGSQTNIIDFVAFSTKGKATDFGNLTTDPYGGAAGSNSTRGINAGGNATSGATNIIDYVTIASAGNATDFGDLLGAKQYLTTVQSSTRLVIGGGFQSDVIQYVTIASTGNATDFGDLTQARGNLSGASSSTRGVFGGGNSSGTVNTIDYITIASTGNATDFGDLTVTKEFAPAVSSGTRAVFGSKENSNVMDYVTIASTGNAQDFGDMLPYHVNGGSVSNSHGGIA